MGCGMKYLSWMDIENDCDNLIQQLEGKDFKAVLGVARGGVVPALLITKALHIPFYDVIGVASYVGHAQSGTIQLIKNPSPELLQKCPQGEGLLIVDDLVDTGDTLRFLRVLYPRAVYAVPYSKPQGHDMADYVAKSYNQEEWLVFPWEKYENSPE